MFDQDALSPIEVRPDETIASSEQQLNAVRALIESWEAMPDYQQRLKGDLLVDLSIQGDYITTSASQLYDHSSRIEVPLSPYTVDAVRNSLEKVFKNIHGVQFEVSAGSGDAGVTVVIRIPLEKSPSQDKIEEVKKPQEPLEEVQPPKVEKTTDELKQETLNHIEGLSTQYSQKVEAWKKSIASFSHLPIHQQRHLLNGWLQQGSEALALEDVIRREVREELGENLQFRLGKLLFVYRILRREDAGWKFVMVYDAEYLGGDIALSEEHANYEWVERDAYEVKQADFFEDDREKHEAFRDHFDSLKK